MWPKVRAFLEQFEAGDVVADVGCGNGKYFQVPCSLYQNDGNPVSNMSQSTDPLPHPSFTSTLQSGVGSRWPAPHAHLCYLGAAFEVSPLLCIAINSASGIACGEAVCMGRTQRAHVRNSPLPLPLLSTFRPQYRRFIIEISGCTALMSAGLLSLKALKPALVSRPSNRSFSPHNCCCLGLSIACSRRGRYGRT